MISKNNLNLKAIITLLLGIIPFTVAYSIYDRDYSDNDNYNKYYKSTNVIDYKSSNSYHKLIKRSNNIVNLLQLFILIASFCICCTLCAICDPYNRKDQTLVYANNIEKEASNSDNTVNQPALAPYVVAYYPNTGVVQPFAQVDTKNVSEIQQIAPGIVPGVAPVVSPITTLNATVVGSAPITTTTEATTETPITGTAPLVTITSSEPTDIKKQ